MANETNDKTLDQTLDQTLNKTELGHVINENKNAILIAGAVIVAVIIGIAVYKHFDNKAEKANLNKAYSIQTSVIDPFLQDELKAAEAVDQIKNIDAEIVGNPNLAPAIFEAVNKLLKEEKTQEAVAILSDWHEVFPSGSYLRFFSGLRLAPLHENAGQPEKAIAVYESLVKGDHDILESRVYLELGRLYLEAGQGEKAKSFFNHILKNHETSEEAKFSRLYLQQLDK